MKLYIHCNTDLLELMRMAELAGFSLSEPIVTKSKLQAVLV